MEIRSAYYLAHKRNFADPINSKCQDSTSPPYTTQSKLTNGDKTTKRLAEIQSHTDVIT